MLIDTIRMDGNIIVIKPEGSEKGDLNQLAEEIKRFISNEGYNNIVLDLTGLNLFDGIKVGVLAATYHFIKFINGKIYLVVNNVQVKKSIDILNLSNAVVVFDKKPFMVQPVTA